MSSEPAVQPAPADQTAFSRTDGRRGLSPLPFRLGSQASKTQAGPQPRAVSRPAAKTRGTRALQKDAVGFSNGVNAIKLLYLPQIDVDRASGSLFRPFHPASPVEGLAFIIEVVPTVNAFAGPTERSKEGGFAEWGLPRQDRPRVGLSNGHRRRPVR